MLLKFSASNYKSFKEGFDFSLVPAPKQKGLDYSILSKKAGRFKYKGISSSVIYGANASGKSNIIGAMDTFKEILLRGNIKNESTQSINVASSKLEQIPNVQYKVSKPISFSISFIEDNKKFDYSLSFDLGIFLEKNVIRKILKEEFKVNEIEIFKRENNQIDICISNLLKKYVDSRFIKNYKELMGLLNSTIQPTELFLMQSFKNIVSPKLMKYFMAWIEDKFFVKYSLKDLYFQPHFEKEGVYIDENFSQVAKIFGLSESTRNIAYLKEENRSPSLYSQLDMNQFLPAEEFESFGTVRFIQLFPLIMRALLVGGTLVIDEFDTSIHPMAVMNLIQVFHDDQINFNKAQIIFNTHNPIFLNSQLLRRDEIKFVEKDDEGNSFHYSLSDFKTSGSKGVRKGEDYLKNYFLNYYGAIKTIDFSEVIFNILKKEGEE